MLDVQTLADDFAVAVIAADASRLDDAVASPGADIG